jgi:hypothetical protein
MFGRSWFSLRTINSILKQKTLLFFEEDSLVDEVYFAVYGAMDMRVQQNLGHFLFWCERQEFIERSQLDCSVDLGSCLEYFKNEVLL